MARKLTLSMILAFIAILILAAPALAGGVVVSLDETPSGVEAGKPFTVGFRIFSAHDSSLQGGLTPMVTVTNPETGETVMVTAEAEGESGHYVASITLPAAGAWNWEIQPFGKDVFNYPASVMTPLQVSAPAAEIAPASQAASNAAPATTTVPETPAVVPWAGFAAIVGLAAAVTAWFIHSQRRVVVRP